MNKRLPKLVTFTLVNRASSPDVDGSSSPIGLSGDRVMSLRGCRVSDLSWVVVDR